MAEPESPSPAPAMQRNDCLPVPRLVPDYAEGIPEIAPGALLPHLGHVLLIDVRRPEEFNGELGHIAGSLLRTLGTELDAFLLACDPRAEIVFVCRSGARSHEATRQSLSLGFSAPRNLRGGMLAWQALGLVVERS